ncbi:MAG: sigma-70 family RNA polymerase sigma factor, partial [Lachnospiraceae bacterium]|nr:sigma-70 family RNA polymerase sigma factor [Lachnospiraceae bacterium]
MTKERMEQIVLENMQKIYLYCVRRLGNTTEAEDVASDVVLELLRSYDKVKEDNAVYGY